MKKTITLVLCLVMMLSLGISTFALGLDRPIFDLDPQEVKDFKALVDAIGEVTLEDKEAIEAAEAAYQSMDADRYSLYKNFRESSEKLVAARAAYDQLVANQAPATGDNMVVFAVLAALSMTGLAVLFTKRRAI